MSVQDTEANRGMGTVALLEASGIEKSFPGVRALRGVDLSVHRGEVLAVLGENGAGKSTLMKVLAGILKADAGDIFLDGEPIHAQSILESQALGIALIHQELNLAANLTVGANLFLGREPRKWGWIDETVIASRSRELLARVGLDVDPTTPVSALSIGQRQLVEIAKALSIRARVLIMDEPTSSLSQSETEKLFEVIHELRDQGVAIIYISHRLGEISALADRILVLRDGENAGQLTRDEITRERMVSLMVGRELTQFYPHTRREPSEVVLDVSDLRVPTHPDHPVTLQLRAGEIVGLAGLVGAGRTELLRTLFGITPALGGTLRHKGEILDVREPRAAIAAGIAMVPEDRKEQGLVLSMTVADNLSLAAISREQRFGFLNSAAERSIATGMTEALHIKTPSSRQIVRFLSGGNQQKVVLGKWLAMHPQTLLLDEPTRGVDVGAKREIYLVMEELAERGVAILFASSDLDEVIGLSDRVLVMHQGRIAGQIPRHALSEEAIMQLATGGRCAETCLTEGGEESAL